MISPSSTLAKNHFILSFKQMGRERIVTVSTANNLIISTICKNYKLAINMTFFIIIYQPNKHDFFFLLHAQYAFGREWMLNYCLQA